MVGFKPHLGEMPEAFKTKMEIKIPFNAWSKQRLCEGRKISTSRTKQYGKVGDTFFVEGKEYKIECVGLCLTERIINEFWRDEGASSPEELKRVLNSIFRGKKLPEYLHLHYFKEVKNANK